jgi:thioredoxin 1
MISPYVDELSETYKDQVSIGKVNVDEEETLADQFGIRNIPTLLFFKNGKIVDKLIGGVTKAAIEAKINALLQ